MPNSDGVSGRGGTFGRIARAIDALAGADADPKSHLPAAIPKRIPRSALEAKAYPGTGVQFVGAPDWSNVIDLTKSTTPDAESLTIRTAALTSAYAFTAIDWRARAMAEALPWVARENAAGDHEWDRRHPLSRLFTNPRPDMGMAELLRLSLRYRDTTGRCVWVVQKDAGGRRARVVPFSGLEVRSRKGEDGVIYGGYEVWTGGAWRAVPLEDVVDFREILGPSWHDLTSRLEVALGMVNLGHSVTRMLRNFMLRAMFPGGVISPDPKWDPTDDDWLKFRDAIAQWYGGPARAGVPLTLKGGATFSRAAMGASDLVPAEVLDRVEASTGSVFGVAPIVLGWLAGLRNAPWSQSEQMERQTYSGTMVGIWEDFGDTLSRALLSEEEREAGVSIRFDTSRVRALQEDDERRARIASMNSPIWTLDERRLYTGKEPRGGEEGDRIGSGFAMPSLAAGATAPPDREDDEEDDEEDDSEEGKARALEAKRAEHKSVWAEFDIATKANEPQWEAAIYSELLITKRDVLALARKAIRSAKALDPSSADGFQLEMTELMREIRPRTKALVEPLLLSTGGQGVRVLAARLSVGFDLLQPGLNDYATREAAFLADVMGETTARLVKDAVAAGLREGDTIGRLMDRLEGLPAFSPDRAKLVARTETTRAWNGAQRESMAGLERRTGRRVTKIWLSSQDGRVRPEHEELDGEQRAIDEPFSNNLQAPGEPNCRCTLTYQVSEPIGGGTA